MSIKIKKKNKTEIWVSAKIFCWFYSWCLKVQQCYKFTLVSFSGIDLCVHCGQIETLQKPGKNVHSFPPLLKEESCMEIQLWLRKAGCIVDCRCSRLTHPWAEALVSMQGRVVTAMAMPGDWGVTAEDSSIHLAFSCTDGQMLTWSPRSLFRSWYKHHWLPFPLSMFSSWLACHFCKDLDQSVPLQPPRAVPLLITALY